MLLYDAAYCRNVLAKIAENPSFFVGLVRVYKPTDVAKVERSMVAWNIDPAKGSDQDYRDEDLEDSANWFTGDR